MPRQDTLKNTLDDAMLPLPLQDFSGGLNSEMDAGDLPLNTSPDCENVYFLPGRLVGRAGYIVKLALPAVPDGGAFFYDASGARRLVVWSNGNLYDVTDFSLTLVASSVYTAGNRVAWGVLASKLYFSDGETIFTSGPDQSGIRYYDPSTSLITAPMVIDSASIGGTIPAPACKAMCVYNGALVCGNLKYVGGTYARDSFTWCAVLDPTTIVGSNVYPIGEGQGGEINCMIPLGIAAVGVSPYQAIFVGKSQSSVHLVKGALTVNDLEPTLIQCPAGVLDGASAKYVSGPQGSAFIVFLGTDRRVWYTNGIETDELSGPIRKELFDYIEDRFTNVVAPQFTAGINYFNRHYILDVGGQRQYCYDWMLKCWTRFRRWRSGFYIEAKDENSASALFVADHDTAQLVQQNAGTTDGGEAIQPYWSSPWLTAGDDDISKLWMWLYLKYRADAGSVVATARVNDGQGNTATATFTPGSAAGNSAVWDSPSSVWDDPNTVWGGGSTVAVNSYKQRARLMVPVDNTDEYKLLRGYNVQLKLSQGATGYFEIMGAQLLYLPRGRRRVA